MHLFLSAADSHTALGDECLRQGMRVKEVSDEGHVLSLDLPQLPWLAFSRQSLLNAEAQSQRSINGWADATLEHLLQTTQDDEPWQWHLWPAYGMERAGLHRCELIRAAFYERLKKRRRVRLKHESRDLKPGVSVPALVQTLLTGPEEGWTSGVSAQQRASLPGLISPFVGGYLAPAEDKAAPSRAFAKVVESELRMGQQIQAGERCVDLGAAPGSWTYVAVQRGARVWAVDRSPLREDLMQHRSVQFVQGDAFSYTPSQKVDWLICDIIAAPERSFRLLEEWLCKGYMRRFIVTLKFKGSEDYPLLEEVKTCIPDLCERFFLSRLCANKNEVCAFGQARKG